MGSDRVRGDGPDFFWNPIQRILSEMTLWALWAKALGAKASKNKKHADIVAIIRTIIFASYFITNGFIMAGVIRHWNDVEYEKPSSISVSK